jgi:Zn-dependent protease
MNDLALTPESVTVGLIWFVVFLFSTTCHEAAHALVAKLGGDTTGASQVTLNPAPHVQREPFGMVVVPILSYVLNGWMLGWASTPYDPYWADRYPHRAARMAIAGPVANFTLMLAAALGIRIGIALGAFRPPESISDFARITVAADPSGVASLLAMFLSVLFLLNLLLGTFNLIPIPPLDGNAAVTIFMSEQKAREFKGLFQQRGFGMMGLLIAWVLFGRIFSVVYTVALNALYFGLTTYG